MTAQRPAAAPAQSHIPVYIAAAVLAVPLALALVIDDLPARVILGVAALGGLQGLWRGISETLGVVCGFVLSAVLAFPLGRAIEPLITSLGAGGLLGRLIAFALVTAIMVAVCAAIGRTVGRKLIARVPALAAWNRLIGAALGAIYGVLLAVFILFIPLALEPVALAQGARAAGSGGDGNGAAHRRASADARMPAPSAAANFVASAADQIHRSSIGATLESLSPVQDVAILNIAADFVAITRDRAALEYLLATPVFRDLANHPTITDAIAKFKADPQLRTLIEPNALERGEGVNAATLAALFTSPVILDLLDHTTIVADLRPRTDEMIKAIRDARAKVAPATK